MPTSPSPWPQLLPTALAGTRRHPLAPLPGLTPALGPEAAAPEKELLLTAANLRLVERAGYRPPGGGAVSLAAPAESLPETGAAATGLLLQLLTTERPLRFIVLQHFLRLLRQHRQRIPRRLLRPLVDTLYQVNYQFLFNTLRDELGGLGNRELALLRLASHWPLDDWARQLGTGWVPGVAAREQPWALGELARQNPHGQGPAMAWLFQVLATEPEEEEQEELWRVLRQWTADGPLPPEAGPLLDPLLDLLGPPGGGPRRVGHGDLAGLRAAMPDSDLPERCWQLTHPHLHLDASPDGQLGLRLGAAAREAPGQHPGLPSADFGDGHPPQLADWLTLVPPSRWLAAWHLTAEQAVAAAAAAAPHEAALVLPAWVRAAATFRDSDFLAALAACYRQHLHHRKPREPGFLPSLATFRDPELLTWLRHLAPELPLPPEASFLEPLPNIWRQALLSAAQRHSPMLLREMLPLLVASQQPGPHPGSQPDREMLIQLLAYNLTPYAHCPDLSILPELRAAFGPDPSLAFAQELAAVTGALQAAQDFEAALLAPAGR